MPADLKTLEKKIQTYSGYKGPRSSFSVSRSLNPEFPHISKFDDVTRFNSANYNVYFYKDYPNRQGTPIKSQKNNNKQEYRKSLSPKKQHLIRLLDNGHPIDQEVKKNLLAHAMLAPLRTDTSPPKFNVVAPGPLGSTMNDFHKRETNAGYARNGSGGFYTR
jgi:hypothetical protein